MPMRLRESLRDLYSGYFALVMATGVVSIACHRLDLVALSWPLLWINVLAYAALWALTVLRLFWFPRRVLADLTSHAHGPGFLTMIAGSGVLGSQILVVTGGRAAAVTLWWLALGLWVVIVYTFFTAVTARTDKPPIEVGLHGAWLLLVVATQSLTVLGGLLALGESEPAPLRLFVLVALHLLGGMLYVPVITLIVYRFVFYEISAETLTPPYWINMGAVAISTLAGATLVQLADRSSLLADLEPFLRGLTLVFWATATWWIPLLFALGVWRHLAARVPLRYHPAYWGMVFPLGMYTSCTLQLAAALDLPFLTGLAEVFVFLALATWLVVAAGMTHALLRSWRAV